VIISIGVLFGDWLGYWLEGLEIWTAAIVVVLPMFLVICRVISVVTFTGPHAAPAGVYAATTWTLFFSHFG